MKLPITRKHFTLLVAVIGSIGCTASSDPLKSFDSLATACRSSLAKPRPVAVNQRPDTSAWTKVVYGPNQVMYDVRKTDSLVSPHVGTIQVEYEYVVLEADSREAAEAAIADGNSKAVLSALSRYRFSFAHQKDTWVTQSMKTAFLITSLRDMPERFVDMSHEELSKQFPEAKACLPPSR